MYKKSTGGKLSLSTDCEGAQTDLNVRCAHVPSCTLCWRLVPILSDLTRQKIGYVMLEPVLLIQLIRYIDIPER